MNSHNAIPIKMYYMLLYLPVHVTGEGYFIGIFTLKKYDNLSWTHPIIEASEVYQRFFDKKILILYISVFKCK